MKKILSLLIAAAVLTLAGCGTGMANSSYRADAAQDEAASNAGIAAGAAIYRGTVTDISSGVQTAYGQEDVIFTAEQHTGTNFGYPSLQFVIGENTRAYISPEEIAVGTFVEIYYGAPSGGYLQQPVTAIDVRGLLPADLVYVNGAVIDVTPLSDQEGMIFLQRTDSMGEVIIRYTSETQFYLNFDDISEGYMLNVFTTGISTRSMPPQMNALEIRPYATP